MTWQGFQGISSHSCLHVSASLVWVSVKQCSTVFEGEMHSKSENKSTTEILTMSLRFEEQDDKDHDDDDDNEI